MNFLQSHFHFRNQKVHHKTLARFLLLVAILVVYFFYVSQEYGAKTGVIVSYLVWSFFVLCTPISDGGFLIAFPIRLLFGVRMFTTQVVSWVLVVIVDGLLVAFDPSIFQYSVLTRLLKKILLTPYPYWGILILSLIGTLASIIFGDEVIDAATQVQHKKFRLRQTLYRIGVVVVLGGLTIMLYYYLLKELQIHI